ncbi:hypothetical protein CCAN2_1720038 [Capnocytophaga canimorsus]|nr:hypothetical protein CCAN2_1720038 [Capnocytophaga canimorsus]
MKSLCSISPVLRCITIKRASSRFSLGYSANNSLGKSKLKLDSFILEKCVLKVNFNTTECNKNQSLLKGCKYTFSKGRLSSNFRIISFCVKIQ